MLRTHTCGELTINDINKTVTLSGWAQISRNLGGIWLTGKWQMCIIQTKKPCF